MSQTNSLDCLVNDPPRGGGEQTVSDAFLYGVSLLPVIDI
jgi:hypothetical protein